MQSVYFPLGAAPDGTELNARVCWQEANGSAPAGAGRPIVIIFHLGGFVLGGAEFVSAAQVQVLTSQGFIAVIPNYRLSPQVAASEGAVKDAESVLAWSQHSLSTVLPSSIAVDTSRIAALGYSSGGTLALSLAAKYPSAVRAVAAFYPSLYLSDLSSAAHQPAAFMAAAPDFVESPESMAALLPKHQVTSFPLAPPGAPQQPRHEWMSSQLKHGTWPKSIQPDGNFAAIDPTTRFADVGAKWPPTIFVQGDQDNIPGSGLAQVERAVKELKSSGASEVLVEVVQNASHVFDLAPTLGTTDFGPKWQAVKKGLDFLRERI